ncbi:MAG: hypothetical protein HGB23_05300 [Chlorobiaceae bacterium]|nr:hypothetical protein [Chlorobiaceae bacterium]
MKLRTLSLSLYLLLLSQGTALSTPSEQAMPTAKTKTSKIAITEISAPIYFREKFGTDDTPFVVKSKDEIDWMPVVISLIALIVSGVSAVAAISSSNASHACVKEAKLGNRYERLDRLIALRKSFEESLHGHNKALGIHQTEDGIKLREEDLKHCKILSDEINKYYSEVIQNDKK